MPLATLNPKQELVLWVIYSFAATIVFFLGHTFYVTAATYVFGAILLLVAAFLFWMRFRKRSATPVRWLRITSNSILVLLSMVLLLYFLGVATWYE